MPKKQLTVLELAEKYLAKLGVSKNVLKTTLLPTKYEDTFMCTAQRKSNVVAVNKRNLAGNETHIAVPKATWPVFFSPAQTSAFATTRATCETDQRFNIFEANVADMLIRRQNRARTSVLIDTAATPVGIYATGTDTVLSDTGRKWIGEQNHATQVHLGKMAYDSNLFKDFRLGILIDDYLLFFKEKHTNTVLAVSIPSEFANRYSIKKVKMVKPSATIVKTQKDTDTSADALFVAGSADSSTPIRHSGTAPIAAPAPLPGRSGKPRYKANPSIGKGALATAGYVCEYCGNGTFTARSTGNDYMEPHHLIPISCQGSYNYSIDIDSNLICLCPNCHSKIHYGTDNDREVMIRHFLALRKADLLAHGGIDIDDNTLLAYYNI